MILKFSLVISLVCNKDTDIEALVPASVSHRCLVLSCLVALALKAWGLGTGILYENFRGKENRLHIYLKFIVFFLYGFVYVICVYCLPFCLDNNISASKTVIVFESE